jgi:methyl coenzyme M reductase subunit D
VISEVEIPNVGYATSLKATVSVTKLTSFVESKGVAVEFKGGILAVNIRQQILNEENETKSMQNIANTCKEILDLSCDFEIVRGEPKQKSNDNNKWAIPISINVKFNKNIEKLNQYLMK